MDSLRKQALLRYIKREESADEWTAREEDKHIMREIGVRNLYIGKRLEALMGALEQQALSAIVLKGAHLMQTIYPFGIRPLEDLDILVDREQFAAVDAIIRSMGYEDTILGMDLWTHLTFSNKITYINKTHPVIPIDVHFSLGPYPYLGRLDKKTLFQWSERVVTPNGLITVLEPEALLLHLCLHLFQHHFENWQVSCCDIVEVLRHVQDRFNWARFTALVQEHHLGLPVQYALQKAVELADIDIHRGEELGNDRANRYERWVFSSTLKQTKESDRYFLQFFTTPGLLPKIRCAAKIMLPGRQYLMRHHQGSYLNYVLSITKTAVR